MKHQLTGVIGACVFACSLVYHHVAFPALLNQASIVALDLDGQTIRQFDYNGNEISSLVLPVRFEYTRSTIQVTADRIFVNGRGLNGYYGNATGTFIFDYQGLDQGVVPYPWSNYTVAPTGDVYAMGGLAPIVKYNLQGNVLDTITHPITSGAWANIQVSGSNGLIYIHGDYNSPVFGGTTGIWVLDESGSVVDFIGGLYNSFTLVNDELHMASYGSGFDSEIHTYDLSGNLIRATDTTLSYDYFYDVIRQDIEGNFWISGKNEQNDEGIWRVNSDGVTIGGTSHYGRFDILAASPIPIPPTLYLFASGILGFAGIARRRNIDQLERTTGTSQHVEAGKVEERL